MSLQSLTFKIDRMTFVQAVRKGLVIITPILMIGSFALMLRFLPIGIYQDFLAGFMGGGLIDFFTMVNQGTFGILSLALVISISVSYSSLKTHHTTYIFGSVVSSVSSYMILLGLFSGDFSVSSLGVNGMFTAIICAVTASWLFCKMTLDLNSFSVRMYTVGADIDFNNAVSSIIPTGIIIILAYILNEAVTGFFGFGGFEDIFHGAADSLFLFVKNPVLKMVLFAALTSVFWFFGIHGSNALESIKQSFLVENMNINVAMVEAGGEATEIFTSNFYEVFVVMGGCGTTIALVLSILFFGRLKNVRNLAKMSVFPMLFNINELLVFGLPIAYNISFFIPFLLTPVACTLISYAAISLGLVPLPVNPVSWVSPVILGGYVATGSAAGSILQIVNIAAGVLIYRFFLGRYENLTAARMRADLDGLIEVVKKAEKNGEAITFLELGGNAGALARTLAEDMKYVLRTRESFTLYYQPQYDSDDGFVGIESLLRWNHPSCGMIYPPLVFGIAKETGQLDNLEKTVFEMACHDLITMHDAGVEPPKASVNITATTLQDSEFAQFLCTLMAENPHMRGVLNIELTEQTSFLLGDEVEQQLQSIRDLGIRFAIDDFSMGHTSLKYLQSSQFDLVKLDGSLIGEMMHNPRSEEIISSIVRMSETMDFKVMAEFVETIEQRDKLKELGCHLYQGYLYSPALPIDKLIERLRKGTV